MRAFRRREGPVLEAEPEALQEVEGVGPKLIASLVAARASTKISEEVEKELERAERLGVALLHLEHPSYPESLRNIYDPPPLLYIRGTLPPALSQTKAIGIVGTRDASQYALNLSLNFGKDLALAGVVVVSGLALGVDSAAHRGAVQSEGGRTVAVLGSGVDVIYPRQNQRLAEEILDAHGAVVSEYRIGSGPRATNFPGAIESSMDYPKASWSWRAGSSRARSSRRSSHSRKGAPYLLFPAESATAKRRAPWRS